MAAKKAFWDTKNPKTSKPLTATQKAAAKARAKKAGRPYPNLVDNAWASNKWLSVDKKPSQDTINQNGHQTTLKSLMLS